MYVLCTTETEVHFPGEEAGAGAGAGALCFAGVTTAAEGGLLFLRMPLVLGGSSVAAGAGVGFITCDEGCRGCVENGCSGLFDFRKLFPARDEKIDRFRTQ